MRTGAALRATGIEQQHFRAPVFAVNEGDLSAGFVSDLHLWVSMSSSLWPLED